MKHEARIGMVGETTFVVEDKHTISFPEQGGPPVLSTPSLIWFLEHAAIEALQPVLDAGEISLGTEVDMQHLAPTPAGFKVICMARVVQSDGPSVAFQLEAHDEKELIARGFHRRRVVRAESFAKRLKAKAIAR